MSNIKGNVVQVVASFELERETVRRIVEALQEKGSIAMDNEYFATAQINFETALEMLQIIEPDSWRLEYIERDIAKAIEANENKYK
tara:strand:- start:65 stop:322 length:258 start_codon:yes stop_codon:yes gene_type:complete